MPYEQSSAALRGDVDAAELSMHRRLIVWGRLFLSGGSGPRQKWDGDDERTHYDFKPIDYDDAKSLHFKVIQLPKPQMALLLQRIYVDDVIAETWYEMGEVRKRLVFVMLADDVNRNIRKLNTQITEPWVQIRTDEIDGIRERAIRLLINRERMCCGRGSA